MNQLTKIETTYKATTQDVITGIKALVKIVLIWVLASYLLN